MALPAQDPQLPEGLAAKLRRSPASELRLWVERYGRFFSLKELRQLLLNPFVDAEILSELASIRTLTQFPAAKAALASHPRTPEAISSRFLPHLFWRQLLDISVNGRLRLSLRRIAERHLIERLPRLARGEKIALARRAAPTTLGALIQLQDLKILAAGLDNPRARDETLMPLLRSGDSLPQALAMIARHRRWSTRYEVRLALCRHPQTPFQDLRRLIGGLRRDDLQDLLLIADHSSLVHQWVIDLLQHPQAGADHSTIDPITRS